MNQRGGLTAAKVVNSYPAQTLTQLLGDWGELDTPWKVANCIVRARETAPIQTTAQLVEAVRPCTPKKDESKFLTKLFQALRIEVNGEMEALKMALEQSLRVLRPGGRLVVISYHSLEDRLVKNFLRSGNFAGAVERISTAAPSRRSKSSRARRSSPRTKNWNATPGRARRSCAPP